ncbi:MAG: hypothetical protein F4Z55_06855 [Boseongicola sp. SB0667_bin_21]|nr:hypothetical protein [Boseongicola sp. SB0667_bin_21]
MTIATLEDKIKAFGGPVDMLRNAPSGPCQFPIRAEFTNWRDEQEAWRHGQAHHRASSRGRDRLHLGALPDLG